MYLTRKVIRKLPGTIMELESVIALCDLEMDGSIIDPKDFKDLSIAIAKDSVNYSAPMAFPRRQIISILTEINKQK